MGQPRFSKRMQPNAAESRYLQRQIAYARPIFLVLAVVDLLELKHVGGDDLPFVFLFISPSEVAIWFPYLFVAFAAGIRWGLHRAIVLAGAVSLALVVRVAIHGVVHWLAVISWTALAVGTFAGGVGLAFLGERSRRHSSENDFLASISSLLQVDQGMAESLRLMLDELARHFDCQEAYLAF